MFSRGMDVVLKYRAIPAITNDSLSKRTMSVVNTVKFHAKSVGDGVQTSIHIEKILTRSGQQ